MTQAVVSLPGDATVDADDTIISADIGGGVRFHRAQALSRLVERWQKPVVQAILQSYADECQEVEAMLWDVLVLRFPDFASGVQLDTIGRIVGEARNGKGDAAYRARVKARIRINSSLGTPVDIIEVLLLIDPARFRIRELAGPAFIVEYTEPVTNTAVATQIPGIVKETKAAGVGARVVIRGGSGSMFTAKHYGAADVPANGLGHYGSLVYGGHLASEESA